MGIDRTQTNPWWQPSGMDIGRRRALAGLSGLVMAAMGSTPAWAPFDAPIALAQGGQRPGGCVLTPEAGEGPFYLDPKLIGSDITSGQPGAPLQLALQVVRAGDCATLANARVDVWHADAVGLYSAMQAVRRRRHLDEAAVGQRYLRGTQFTDAAGHVQFRTIFPSWYGGRTPHVHFKVFLGGNEVVASQIFFPDEITREVFSELRPIATTRRSARPSIRTTRSSRGSTPTSRVSADPMRRRRFSSSQRARRAGRLFQGIPSWLSSRCLFGLLFRAPERMPAIPTFPSWQAYSSSGSFVRLNRIRAVHGRVQVVGSFMVASYCSVSSATRVKRSTRRRPLDDPGSCSSARTPSFRPPACRPPSGRASRPATAGSTREVRASVERDDARVMDGLHREDDVAGGLHDLVDAAVGGLEPGHAEGDAPFGQAAALGTVRRMQPPLFGQRRAPRLRLGCFGRDSPVRRIDDERRPIVDIAAGQPEAVVVAGLGIVRGRLLLAGEDVEDQLVPEQGVPSASSCRLACRAAPLRRRSASSCWPTRRAAAAA